MPHVIRILGKWPLSCTRIKTDLKTKRKQPRSFRSLVKHFKVIFSTRFECSFHIFSTRFECSVTSSPLVSSVVLSTPELRKKYDCEGIVQDNELPEWDAVMFFSVLIGSEKFTPFIGKLNLKLRFKKIKIILNLEVMHV